MSAERIDLSVIILPTSKLQQQRQFPSAPLKNVLGEGAVLPVSHIGAISIYVYYKASRALLGTICSFVYCI